MGHRRICDASSIDCEPNRLRKPHTVRREKQISLAFTYLEHKLYPTVQAPAVLGWSLALVCQTVCQSLFTRPHLFIDAGTAYVATALFPRKHDHSETE